MIIYQHNTPPGEHLNLLSKESDAAEKKELLANIPMLSTQTNSYMRCAPRGRLFEAWIMSSGRGAPEGQRVAPTYGSSTAATAVAPNQRRAARVSTIA